MYCEHLVLKTYLREKQLTTRASVIVVKVSNSKIANKIATTTKTK